MHTIRPAALLAALLAAPAMADAATTALQCGNIYDSKSARLVGEGTIIVTDGRVAQVLRERAAPAGAEIVDLAGHTCMPGWIDLHVHLSQESNPDSYSEHFRLDDTDFAYRSVGYAEKTLLAGFTTVRDLGGQVSIDLRNAIDQGYVKGRASTPPESRSRPRAATATRTTGSIPRSRRRSARPARPRA
jgi:imidazolonepropionase-like amidohydrolase